MKNNSKLIYLVITAIVVAFIGFFIFAKKSDDVHSKELMETQEKISSNRNTLNANDGITNNAPNLPHEMPPKWVKSTIAINDSSTYSREDKIHKLVDLLKQNESNPDALSVILVSLTNLDPIEAADDIIPYLKDTNPKVQILALGVLYNASLLTKKEHELKRSLSENEAVRKRIIEAVNELKVDPNTSDEVKKVLIATFP
jgi:HEAT repeat protein